MVQLKDVRSRTRRGRVRERGLVAQAPGRMDWQGETGAALSRHAAANYGSRGAARPECLNSGQGNGSLLPAAESFGDRSLSARPVMESSIRAQKQQTGLRAVLPARRTTLKRFKSGGATKAINRHGERSAHLGHQPDMAQNRKGTARSGPILLIAGAASGGEAVVDRSALRPVRTPSCAQVVGPRSRVREDAGVRRRHH